MRHISIPLSVLLLLSIALLQGCYLTKQGWHLFSDLSRAKSINRLLKKPTLDSELREFLENVQEIHQTAIEVIGLEKDKNYTKYIDVDRTYSVIALSASKDSSFERHYWNYPIYGKLPYRGYYVESDANKEAQKLEQRNYDILLRPVSAFSSQDYFRSPIYSFMINRSKASLSELIFHELAHSRLWLKKYTQFNEEFATFVGLVGSLYYLEKKYGSDSKQFRDAVAMQKDFKVMYERMFDLREELAELYAKDLPRDSILADKQRIIRNFKTNFGKSYDDLFLTDAYRDLSEYTINNAYLNMFDTYMRKLDLFYAVYDHFEQDLAQTIHHIASIQDLADEAKKTGNSIDPYEHLRKVLQ